MPLISASQREVWAQRVGEKGTPFFVLVGSLLCTLPLPMLSGAAAAASGLLFGTLWGTLVFTASASLGALCALLLVRSTLRAPVQRAAFRWKTQFKSLDAAIEADAFSIVFLLRLSPVVPFAVASVLLALTPVPVGTYIVATVLGSLPASLPYAYAGHVSGLLAGSMSGGSGAPGGENPYQVAMSCVGFLATVAVSWKLTNVVKRALSAAAEESEGRECEAEGLTGGREAEEGGLGGLEGSRGTHSHSYGTTGL